MVGQLLLLLVFLQVNGLSTNLLVLGSFLFLHWLLGFGFDHLILLFCFLDLPSILLILFFCEVRSTQLFTMLLELLIEVYLL